MPRTAKPEFRLILSGPGSPARNMALDEALFRGVIEGGRPCLRFYAWDPPGLSLGRLQRDLTGIDLDFCRRSGIPVVRRRTGGRAVLHYQELTYSIICRHEHPFGSGVVETYARIAAALTAGLAKLGARVETEGVKERAGIGSPNCFSAPSRWEITWRGRKLVGSAQRRDPGGFLQHGSILLSLDRDLWQGVFPGGLSGRGVGLDEILGRPVDSGMLVLSLRAGFEEALDIVLTEDELKPSEERDVAERAAESGNPFSGGPP
jgi:lipoate-protein ligase A